MITRSTRSGELGEGAAHALRLISCCCLVRNNKLVFFNENNRIKTVVRRRKKKKNEIGKELVRRKSTSLYSLSLIASPHHVERVRSTEC